MGSIPKSFTWKVGNIRLGEVRSPQVGADKTVLYTLDFSDPGTP